MPQKLTYAQQMADANFLRLQEFAKSLPEIARRYLNAIADITSPLTRLGYARDLLEFFRYLHDENISFGEIPVTEIKPNHLDLITVRDFEDYANYLTLHFDENDNRHANGDQAKQRKLCSLRSFFHYCFRLDLIEKDQSLLIVLPKSHAKPILRLEPDEVAKLLDIIESGQAFGKQQNEYNVNTKERDFAMIVLMLGTGIRVSELVGLDMEHVFFETNSIIVTRKGGATEEVYFSDEVANALRSYLSIRMKIDALPGHEAALFLSLQRKRIGVRSVEMVVKKYAMVVAPAKSKLSPHKLRSTYGTNLYAQTGDIYLVADALGHKDVNTTTRHYAAMSEERRRSAPKYVHLRDD